MYHPRGLWLFPGRNSCSRVLQHWGAEAEAGQPVTSAFQVPLFSGVDRKYPRRLQSSFQPWGTMHPVGPTYNPIWSDRHAAGLTAGRLPFVLCGPAPADDLMPLLFVNRLLVAPSQAALAASAMKLVTPSGSRGSLMGDISPSESLAGTEKTIPTVRCCLS